MEKRNTIYKTIGIVLGVLVLMGLIVFLVGRSFGFFSYAKKGDTVNVVTINGITVTINSGNNALNLQEAYPMYDIDGMQGTPFVFTLTNTSSRALSYSLVIENDEEKQETCTLEDNVTPCTPLLSNYIRYSYKVGNGNYSTPANLGANNNVIFTETINGNTSKQISLLIWIDSTAQNDIQGDVFFGKIIVSGGNPSLARCDMLTNTSYNFFYDLDGNGLGQEQVFNAPCDGTYKLEVWGAQGGNSTNSYDTNLGGYGAYSTANIQLHTNDSLYINVGGKGVDSTTTTGTAGGYNGGGSGGNSVTYSEGDSYYYREYRGGAGGGGATHIASSQGLLQTFGNKLNDIIIVAGGGGGATSHWNEGMTGGSAGGYLGARGQNCENPSRNSPCSYFLGNNSGGSQSTGYALGLGQDGLSQAEERGWGQSGRAGGGGGYYGGYASQIQENGAAAGGGGSGYIGNASLSDGIMFCYGCSEDLVNAATFTVSTIGTSNLIDTTNCLNGYSETPISKCAKVGNGHARITYLGNN